MDWNLVWAGTGVFVATAAVIIPWVSSIRQSDKNEMNEKLKEIDRTLECCPRCADIDAIHDRFKAVDKSFDSVARQMADKAHKDELKRIEDRFERDIADLRTDQKAGFAEIRADIKDMRTDLMIAIREAVNK